MSNKIRYRPESDGDYVEFNSDILAIKLPNGSTFRLNFDPKEGALVVQKEWGENMDSRITVHPNVSNVILVK